MSEGNLEQDSGEGGLRRRHVVRRDGLELGVLEVWVFRQKEIMGVQATFTAGQPEGSPMTLAELARSLDADHFNWYQIAASDSNPYIDPCGHRMRAPYVDPPQGGYPPSKPGGDDGEWSDKIPWYQDETEAPPGYEGEKYLWWQNISEDGRTTHFRDDPAFTEKFQTRFRTWLVAVRSDHRPAMWLDGFEWESVATGVNEGHVTIRQILTEPPNYYEYTALVEEGTAAQAWFWLPAKTKNRDNDNNGT